MEGVNKSTELWRHPHQWFVCLVLTMIVNDIRYLRGDLAMKNKELLYGAILSKKFRSQVSKTALTVTYGKCVSYMIYLWSRKLTLNRLWLFQFSYIKFWQNLINHQAFTWANVSIKEKYLKRNMPIQIPIENVERANSNGIRWPCKLVKLGHPKKPPIVESRLSYW